MEKRVQIEMPELEAAILLEYADRVASNYTFDSKAEEIVFWRLIAALEKEVSITFREDYRSLLDQGKAQIEAESR
jgi:hypothetical protein